MALHLLTFFIDDQLLALPLSVVERVIWVVEITPLPTLDPNFLGVIQMQEQVIAVTSMRRLLGIEEKSIDLMDQLMICQLADKKVAVLVDKVSGLVIHKEEDKISPFSVFLRADAVDYVVKEQEKALVVYRLQALLESQAHYGEKRDG